MKIRLMVLALVAMAGLAACSSDDTSEPTAEDSATSSPSVTETPTEEATPDNAVQCTALTDSIARMTQFGTAYTGGDAAETGESAQTAVDTLKTVKGVPADVQKAVTAVIKGFSSAIKPNGSFDMDAIMEIAPALQKAGEVMAAYVAESCTP